MIGSFDSVKFDSSSPSSGYVLVNQGECPLKHIYISVDVTHGSVSDYIEYSYTRDKDSISGSFSIKSYYEKRKNS